jgi:hypothetical protein
MVFDRYTKPKARREWRLLIVDGHGSHLTMRFLDWCKANRILVAAFPPLSTHRLQPLDVFLFSPLATYYSQELDRWIHNCQGLVSITKRHFWKLFWVAYNKAFTKNNINSGWKKTGLHPFNPDIVLNQHPKKSEKLPSPSKSSSTTLLPVEPTDTKGIRKLLDDMVLYNTCEGQKLRSTVWALTGRAIRAEGEIKGMAIALKDKRNKGKGQGKGLMDELRAEGKSKFLFLSPKKIARAKELKQIESRQNK